MLWPKNQIKVYFKKIDVFKIKILEAVVPSILLALHVTNHPVWTRTPKLSIQIITLHNCLYPSPLVPTTHSPVLMKFYFRASEDSSRIREGLVLNVVVVAKDMSGEGQGTQGLCSEKLLSISQQTKSQVRYKFFLRGLASYPWWRSL